MTENVLLIVGDSPTLNTGFAKVVASLARRWKSYFSRIDFWAIGFSGYPGAPGRVRQGEWMQPPYVLYPAVRDPGDVWHSRDRLQALISHVRNGDYTHVFVIQDHFQLARHNFPKIFRMACDATTTQNGSKVPRKKSYYYIPVDARMDPRWCEAIEAFDFPVAYTNFGRLEILAHTGLLGPSADPLPDIRVLPHGVDTSVYFPMADRVKMRNERSGGWIQADDIVLINVNANQRRKDVVRSLELLAALRKVDQRFKLIMHMSDMQPAADGISLKVAAEQLGLKHGDEWQCTDTGSNFMGIIGLLSESDLNALYNCADIYLTTSLGEGWGLGITEALSAGLAVAIPEHTACKEIADKVESMGMLDRVIRLALEQGTVCLNMDNSRLRQRVEINYSASRILRFVHSGKLKPVREGLNERAHSWLSWDQIANKWLTLFQEPKPPRRYFIELYGGLGDMFNGLYHRSAGQVLDGLTADERATVVLYTNNPYANELFTHHPRKSQIEIVDPGLWRAGLQGEWQDLVQRARADLSLPRRGAHDCLPDTDAKTVEFYPTPEDLKILPDGNAAPYLVIAPSAGLIDRNLPGRFLVDFAIRLRRLHEHHGIVTFWVGRTYERHGRMELLPDTVAYGDWCVNMVDRLTVPGVAVLLQNSAGLITCHSALNPLAWRMRKPQLLLYPRSVYEMHYKPRDQWSFGADDPLCLHSTFDDYDPRMLERFIRLALGPLAVRPNLVLVK